ncbi:MAG TPA: 16S rRNA (guanine(966)-N(2))-methyltransferase RsmD [Anaerolineaceae bacterium]|nr:16S rRNA (guanine(966)-N(2))-methyltransferase RsmD [Anaerolineaceae bacterium]HOR83232.1 16S rRNA (guanine(966)-N(2))-methyltransferase RsmD [Anaerolineaceae bacterium]HPL43190.1 16S rRNA (guanine(966)-N(2))-methyltransferase RsmD [Anaerolineaceae bacterium]HQC20221.1 16S rRNA (guanine(966)-N(2))-methyltransferase RsmD [Anaerolineaceae bacterium]
MGTLRVIGGEAKGLRLKTVPGDTTRPITDLVKEALFNILGDEVLGAHILDLFGGTGAVGIEALSRGAESALFLDKSREAVRTIQDNLRTTRLDKKARVLHQDAFLFLSQPPTRAYEMIYIAPPQYKGMWQKAMDLLDQQPAFLSPEGQIIVQINPVEWEERRYHAYSEFDRRKYGDTLLVFFEHAQAENDITN